MEQKLSYRQVDVFSKTSLSGNGLAVFANSEGLSTEMMQSLAQEMRQYESIFLFKTSESHRFKARIFTMEEELDFAGHPILGAACVLHEQFNIEEEKGTWVFELRNKSVTTTTLKQVNSYFAKMDQGAPHFEQPFTREKNLKFLKAFSLSEQDVHETLPLQIVSTGLPYLIIPVQCDLEKVKIVTCLDKMLAETSAKFAYILNVQELEGRTWDNEGRVEDIATGSAAGPVGAYLTKHGIKELNTEITINQGRFVGRPSQIFVKVIPNSVEVSGWVCMVARGVLD